MISSLSKCGDQLGDDRAFEYQPECIFIGKYPHLGDDLSLRRQVCGIAAARRASFSTSFVTIP